MELFRLFGSIVVDNRGANASIEETVVEAERANTRMETSFGNLGEVFQRGLIPAFNDSTSSMKDFGENVGNTFQSLGTLGNIALGTLKGSLIGLITLFSTSLIPIIASATAGIGILGASFASVGVGAIGAGVVIKGVLGSIFDASTKVTKAQNELTNATTKKERIKALQDMQKATAGLDATQKTALKSLQGFKAFWQDFLKSFKAPVLDIFNKSLQALQKLLVLAKPAISGVISGIQVLLGELNTNLGSSPIKSFFTWIGTNAKQTTITFGEIVGNVFEGILNLLGAFAPSTRGMNQSLLQMSENFKKWSETVAQSKGFQDFMNYVKTNAPKVLSTIGSIGTGIVNLARQLAPTGSQMLSDLSGFANWLATKFPTMAKNAMDALKNLYNTLKDNGTFTNLGNALQYVATHMDTVIKVGGTLLGVFTAFAVVSTIANIITVLGSAFKIAGATGRLLSVAMDAIDIAMDANPIGLVIVAIAGLIAIIIIVVNHMGGFKKVSQELWSALKSAFSGGAKFIEGLLGGITKFMNGIVSGLKSAVTWAGKLVGINGKKSSSSSSKTPKNANGTSYFEGGWTVVGEQGRELVQLPTGSRIYNNPQSESMMKNGGGGITQNITINSPQSLNAGQTARALKKASQQLALNN